MKKFPAAVVLACMGAALWSAPSLAQFAKPEDAVKYRQSALTLIASHFGRMQPVVRGQAPYDAEQIKANVQLLRTLATLPWPAFGAGTEGGGARAEIWQDADGFRQKQQDFLASVDKLSAAADSGDLAQLRAAYGNVGASCKACHDAYRQRR